MNLKVVLVTVPIPSPSLGPVPTNINFSTKSLFNLVTS
jgi:hypothetical protein